MASQTIRRLASSTTALALAVLIAACSTPASPPTAMVSGTATYRERMALPPGAVFEARLEDVSRADAPAVLIASIRAESPGAPPFRFAIPYDPARIAPAHNYAIRARVMLGEEPLFVSDTRVPLPSGPDAAPLTITMVRAAATLEDTRWELVRLGDAPVVLEAGQRAPYIVLAASDRRVSGFAGCNRLMGDYKAEGAKLTFTQLAGTMMACAQGMELEQALHAALAKVAGWRLEGNDLTLLDAGGTALASFRSG